MRIESSGIYNNRGLLNDKNRTGATNNIVRQETERFQIPKAAKATGVDKPAETKALTPAESLEIFRLFGKFDAGTLDRQPGGSGSNPTSGRYVDIIV